MAGRPAPQEQKHTSPWPDPHQHQGERLPPWGPGTQSGSRNVWGSPNNDRSLGNGTFGSDLGNPVQTLPAPGPIGPPAGSRATSTHAQGQEPAAARIPPIGPPGGRGSQATAADQRPASFAPWQQHNGRLESDEAIFEETRRRELESRGMSLGESQPLIKDTWKPANLNDSGVRGSAQGVNKLVHETKGRPAGPTWPSQVGPGQADYQGVNGLVGDVRGSASLGAPGQMPGLGASQPRGSRFFPAKETGPTETPPPGTDRTKSPTPPPPTMADHPAYDGDAARPHVALPPQKPVVRLPPAPATAPRTQPAPMPSGVSGTASHPQNTLGKPHEHVENWQDKINNLIGRKSSPQKVATDSSARSGFDHIARDLSRLFGSQVDERSFTTKEMDETCFEEQEMGSLPPVNLPSKAPDAAWAPAVAQRSMPRKFLPVVSSADPITFTKDVSGNGVVLRVFVPNMKEAVTVTMTHGRGSNNRGRGNHSNRASMRHASGNGHRGSGGKGRDGSSNFSGEHASGSTNNTPSSSRSGRGFRGGRSEGWGRHASSTSQQQ